MLRSLLEDRFHLVAHYESRTSPVYALVVDKQGNLGPGMHASGPDEHCVPLEKAAAAGGAERVRRCGLNWWIEGGQRIHVAMAEGSMDQITRALTKGVMYDRPLVDRTGLRGKYDFEIVYVPEVPPALQDRSTTSDREAVGELINVTVFNSPRT